MDKKKTRVLVLVILSFLILLSAFEMYNCPIKIIFGLSCPTCGITRAIISAIQLDFTKAFYYHLFWPVVVIILIVYLLYEFKVVRLNKKILLLIACIICILNLIYYLYRLFNGSDIVYYNFTDSLIYKIIKLLS